MHVGPFEHLSVGKWSVSYTANENFFTVRSCEKKAWKKIRFAGIWTLYDTGQDKRSNQYS